MTFSSTPEERMVLIIGGGFAGAACALRLSEHGIKSVLIEAQHRLGGRAQTVELAPGVLIDFGASNVHGYEHGDKNPARRLAEKLGIELQVPKPSPGHVYTSAGKQIPTEQVTELRGKIGRIMGERTSAKPEGEDSSLSKRVIAELQALSPDAEGLARTAELGAGIRLEDISAKYWKTERGFAGIDALPVGGYSEMVRKAIEQSEAEVHLGQDVKTIQQTDSGSVKVTTQQDRTFQGSHVIVTAPTAVLQKGHISFSPSLPGERQSLLSRVSIGLLDKLALLYDSVWWPADAANFVLLPPSPPAAFSSSSSIEDVLQNTTLMVANMHALSSNKPPVLLVYLPPHAAAVLEHFSDADLTPAFHAFIQSRLQGKEASGAVPAPKLGRMVRWKADPYALGATTSPIALGKDAQPDDLDRLGEALWDGKLGFAGEGTDRHLRGSVPGAVASGEREADRLAKLLAKL